MQNAVAGKIPCERNVEWVVHHYRDEPVRFLTQELKEMTSEELVSIPGFEYSDFSQIVMVIANTHSYSRPTILDLSWGEQKMKTSQSRCLHRKNIV